MTIWNTIYKEKKKKSSTWATPSERFYPLFRKFLKRSTFDTKHALDIGCGIGNYLKRLQSYGFKTDGIDSSKTAVAMTKELLRDNAAITCADMYNFTIPQNKYDLIISILTIHHGTKKQVQNLINKIHRAIRVDGKIFITLPDFKSSKQWGTFKDHKKIGNGTFVPLLGPEKGLPHSFYTKEEMKRLLSKFRNVKLDIDDQGNWIVQASK